MWIDDYDLCKHSPPAKQLEQLDMLRTRRMFGMGKRFSMEKCNCCTERNEKGNYSTPQEETVVPQKKIELYFSATFVECYLCVFLWVATGGDYLVKYSTKAYFDNRHGSRWDIPTKSISCIITYS